MPAAAYLVPAAASVASGLIQDSANKRSRKEQDQKERDALLWEQTKYRDQRMDRQAEQERAEAEKARREAIRQNILAKYGWGNLGNLGGPPPGSSARFGG